MSVSDEQMTKFFESKGNDDKLAATLREAIPEPPPVTPEPEAPEVTLEKPTEPAKAAEPEKPIPEAKFVPLEALQEERAEKKQLRDELAAYRKWQEQVNEQLKRLPAEQQEQAPDPQQDPFGYQSWALQKLNGGLQDMQTWRQQQEQTAQQQATIQRYANWATAQEAEFTKTEPKYPDAYRFAAEMRDKELQALGYRDPQMRQAIISSDTQAIVNNAIQLGVNPAKLVWDFAASKGFNAKPANSGDPHAAAKIAAGLQQAPKLDKGGQTPDGEVTAKDLANINDPAEFEKQWKKVFGKR